MRHRPPSQADRAPKRPRLSSEVNKENTKSAPTTKDEDALMAELLAGIDASVFDLPPSQSPVKSHAALTPTSRSAGLQVQRSAAGQRHPGGVSPPRSRRMEPAPAKGAARVDQLDGMGAAATEREPLKPVQTAQLRAPAVSVSTVQSRPRVEPLDEEKPAVLPPTPDLGDLEDVYLAALPLPGTQEDDYDGDWDMAALAGMDEGLLQAPAKYPIAHPAVPPPPVGYAPTPWARCVVESVHDGLLERIPENGVEVEVNTASQWSKTLVVAVADEGRRLVHLKERWVDLKIRPGDIVNIISPSLDVPDIPIVITFRDAASYIVHHPDVLITMTAIANAMPCARRPLVQALVKLPEPPSKAMLYGNVLHGLLQGSLTEQTFTPAATARRVAADLALDERRLEIWGANLEVEGVAEDIGPKAADAFEAFGRKWIGPEPNATGEVITARDEPAGTLAITGLHDIEEDIWSPKWGLKGKVDASVQVRLKRDANEEEAFVAPLEIKTGRSIGGVSHRAQTMLYTLLMEDRYGLPVPAGLLYYSQRDAIVLVDARANEVRALVMARNELAEWMVREREASVAPPSGKGSRTGGVPFLPETLDNTNECTRCYAASVCMLYRKAVDTPPAPEEDPIAELFEAKTGHLTPAHAAFFAHWERLLTLEEQDTVRLRAQLWTMTAKAREKAGRCFANMVVTKEENVKTLNKNNSWVYTFTRATGADGTRGSLLSGHISRGDPVALSIEPDLLCLARGFVTALTPESLSVTIRTKLDLGELLARTQRSGDHTTAAFRIDKDELSAGMARMRGSLAQLFVPEGDATRRRLVVDLAAPTFDEDKAPTADEIPRSLNADQAAAMTKVITANDYALVLGMPGTGKTTTVAEIIKALVERGNSVLLTSYTHSAVDTIVTKLLGADFQVLRVGNPDKVHPDIKHLTLDAMGPAASAEQLEARMMSPPVVATTCLSVDHPLFFRRHFDYCIVDEASQITLPTCLGPLRCADKFVLVGDHFQLPPIVRKAAAREGGLDVSLFRRLSDAHPAAVAPLAAQYRMNEDIMELSNRLIYGGRLRCGSDEVARQVLKLPGRMACRDVSEASCKDDCWIQGLLEEDTKAVFMDTDLVPARHTRVGSLVQNPTEASLVFQLARALVASGVRQHDICVITPYRQQIKLLTGLFASELGKVEILTADKAQGRDKECVLVSLVRSNEDGNIGELLRDWRRINVSFTRAKRKLVIFGSRSTLATDKLLADFFALVDEKGWSRRLPVGGDAMHGTVVMPETAAGGEENKKDAKERKGVLGERMLSSRPFVKEILEGDE